MTKPKKLGWDFSTVIKMGAGCRSLVPQTFCSPRLQRVALITDKGLIEAGVVEKVREAFQGQNVQIAGTFDGVRQDNDTRDIGECARWYRDVGADGLLAVGGGSVLDTAKCVKVMLGMKVDNITDLMTGHQSFFYKRPEAKPLGIPHISIPTTARHWRRRFFGFSSVRCRVKDQAHIFSCAYELGLRISGSRVDSNSAAQTHRRTCVRFFEPQHRVFLFYRGPTAWQTLLPSALPGWFTNTFPLP